jgi:hypothetical protein
MSEQYLTPRRLSAIERSLSDRDRSVLTSLHRLRMATADQLTRLHFTDVSPRQARASLASLVERRLVARLPRPIGGVRAGSAGYIYLLDVAGVRLTRPTSGRVYRPWQAGWPFLTHSLAVTEVIVRLVEADRAGHLRLLDFSTEPATWRSFPAPGGGRLILKPDAAVTVQLGQFEDRWFLEIDRGTEATTTIGRACDRYRAYWSTGLEQEREGVFPRVLWLVPDASRYQQLVETLAKQPAEAWSLFAVALFDDAVSRLAQGAKP